MEIIDVPSFSNKKNKKTLSNILKPLPYKVREKLLALYKENSNIKIQSFIDIPKQWISLSDLEKLERYIQRNKIINHRTIQKNEIIIDVDSETKEYGKIHLAVLERFWNILKYRREQYDSGGDGYHIQFIFKQLNGIADSDISQVKKDLISYLCGPFMFMYRNKDTNRYIFSIKNKHKTTLEKENLEQVSHICVVDKKLIQIEYAKHRKGGTKLPYISDLKFTNSPLIEGITPRIPSFIKELIQSRKDQRKKEYTQRKWTTEQLNLLGSKYPPCIRFYLGEEINKNKFIDYNDGTKRAMFHLISFFTHTKQKEELVDFITEWLEKISVSGEAVDSHGKRLDKYLIRMSINSNKGLVSCNARKQLLEELGCENVCEGCPYKR